MELLKEKLVLVTGAGRGLGAAISSGAAEQGARVILVDIDGTAAKAQADALTAKGFVAEGHALDVTDRDAFDQPEAVEVWDRVIGVNLEGAFNVSHALVPALKAAKGNVVHLCSVAGFVSGGSTAGYVVSKGAIRSLTQVMARDLAPHGIRVNAVAPGIMMSEMAVAQLNRPGGTDWFMNRVMMKRIGETSEVVDPVVFLASPMASYITGTILPVDGGFLAA
ncbi:SDR family NAD(P)-dependent oxidoreductase [Brucella abortus]|uniref:SDR family NAD(P)-dependent oxidoreductase n=1 Tax=Brucella abortus TaxID=235 RepID=UPI0018E1C0F2|nr:SDR family oxidoreductase [Brucella abortus]MBI1659106.1 SDR family oxidoreductase [Brucella abortus]